MGLLDFVRGRPAVPSTERRLVREQPGRMTLLASGEPIWLTCYRDAEITVAFTGRV